MSDYYWDGKIKKKHSKAKLLLYPKKKFSVTSQKNKEALARLKEMVNAEEMLMEDSDGN